MSTHMNGNYRLALAFFVLSTVLFVGGIAWLRNTYVAPNEAAPEMLLGGPVPAGMRAISVLRMDEGVIGEIYDPATRHKVGLAVTLIPPASPQPEVQVDLVRAVIEFTRSEPTPPSIAPFVLRYAAAQLDPRRAYEITPSTITIDGRTVATQKFRANRGANYELGIINGQAGQILFLALRKHEAVDSTWLASFLAQAPAARQG